MPAKKAAATPSARGPAKKTTAAKKQPAKRSAAKRKPAAERSPRREKVLDAVERDLAVIAKVDKTLATSALAVLAQTLAREIDSTSASTTSRITGARALIDTLDRLREQLPEKQEGDRLDELNAERAARLAGGTAT